MRPLVVALALPCVLLVTPASAAGPNSRVFGAASAAVMGGIVGGPVGLVAGAAIGYFLTPAVLDGAAPRARHGKRRVRRGPALAAVPAPESYAMAPQQAYGQPVYLAQQAAVPLPQSGYTNTPPPYGVSLQAGAQGAPPAQTQSYVRPSVAPSTRPAFYAAVPPPQSLAPGGNYAARAYQPRDAEPTR